MTLPQYILFRKLINKYAFLLFSWSGSHDYITKGWIGKRKPKKKKPKKNNYHKYCICQIVSVSHHIFFSMKRQTTINLSILLLILYDAFTVAIKIFVWIIAWTFLFLFATFFFFQGFVHGRFFCLSPKLIIDNLSHQTSLTFWDRRLKRFPKWDQSCWGAKSSNPSSMFPYSLIY